MAASPSSSRARPAHLVVFGLGSNLGACRVNLRQAATQLVELAGLAAARRSRIYLSEPWGPPQPVYLNAAVGGCSCLSLEALLAVALRVERSLGRVRGVRWGARSIDIDLLWSDALVCTSACLTVPHPGLGERPFALRPLLDIAPQARIPTTGERYGDLVAARSGITVAEPL